MRTTRVLLLVAFVAASGCGDDPKPPEDSGPFLSQEPIWSLEQDTRNGASCFGNSVALGDFNGDGRRDLVAGLPSCTWAASQGKGQVAIYTGAESFFSQSATTADMQWQNTSTATSGRGMSVAVGEVNGDGYADLLVRGTYGVQVFTGKADLGEMLSAPVFRVPGNGVFSTAFLSDLNGDGLDDLVSLKLGKASIYLSTPQAETGPFTLARTMVATYVQQVGDTNGDGVADLLLLDGDGEQQLYLGCKQGSALTCEGPVTAEPVWNTSHAVHGTFPDQNGDGRAEFFMGDDRGGRTSLYLSDAASGGASEAPVWSVLGDPLFPDFGRGFIPVGDLDGDGQSTEFIIGAFGRLYLYTPRQGISDDLKPVWAWPGSDSFEGQHEGLTSYSVLAPGDLNGDGLADLLVSAPPSYQSSKPGRVFVLAGGKVPKDTATPFLPEKRNCIAGTGGKPDLTVDGDSLGRSLYLERKSFSDTSCEVLEGCVNGPGERRLLRFSVSIPNMGTGPMLIPGPSREPSLYQYDSCHGHDHLIGFASYELRDAQGTVTATGRKQGFNLIDFQPYCLDAPAPAPLIGDDMVISPGWADIYTSDLPCQWLDVTNVPDGTYSLRVAVDTRDIVDEDDKLPDFADVKLSIQGDSVKLEP